MYTVQGGPLPCKWNSFLGSPTSRQTGSSSFCRDVSNWQLLVLLFKRIFFHRGLFCIDFFSSRWNHQLPLYFSWLLDPGALAADAFIHKYAFPYFSMITHLIRHICLHQVTLLLIIPLWPWFHALLELFCADPSYCRSNRGLPHTVFCRNRLRFVACTISGTPSAFWAYHYLLTPYSGPSGHPALAEDTLTPGMAGLARQAHPSPTPVTLVVNFLAELFLEGKSYCTVNFCRSAILASHV